MKHTHYFDFMFSVESSHDDPDDVSADDLRHALQKRLDSLGDLEIKEACGCVETVEENDV